MGRRGPVPQGALRTGSPCPPTMTRMEHPTSETTARSWLRCYRCWSQELEVQVHYEGIHKIDPETGE